MDSDRWAEDCGSPAALCPVCNWMASSVCCVDPGLACPRQALVESAPLQPSQTVCITAMYMPPVGAVCLCMRPRAAVGTVTRPLGVLTLTGL
jgi:hypothetical protein